MVFFIKEPAFLTGNQSESPEKRPSTVAEPSPLFQYTSTYGNLPDLFFAMAFAAEEPYCVPLSYPKDMINWRSAIQALNSAEAKTVCSKY